MISDLIHQLRSRAASRLHERRRRRAARRLPYPVSIRAQHAFVDSLVEGTETFDRPDVQAFDAARLAHLDSLGLELSGKTVLDAGAGVGHLAQHLAKSGARVTCVEGRSRNVERMRELYPQLEARVLDVDRADLTELGSFDITLCYGLLYHLENPVRALRGLAAITRELLLIETIVLDHHLPLLLLDEETGTSSQALAGIGCRPTPSFVALALREAGMPHVYAPTALPDHPFYRYRWRDDLTWTREGQLLRAVFVASHRPLEHPGLTRLIS